MRNLRIVGRSLLRFSGHDPLPLTATAWDPASNTTICAFGPAQSRASIELKRLYHDRNNPAERLQSIASWDAPCSLPSLTCDSILSLHHFADSSTSCLVLAGGDIILVRECPLESEELVEIVGTVDAGIAAAAWSPDEELLSIVTQANTLLLMSRAIDNIAAVTLTPDDVNVSNHVSVGWGKKETQFKGRGARALQDPTLPDTIDEGVLSSFDDCSITISWRGDGAYFAVSKVEDLSDQNFDRVDRRSGRSRRMIRIYSREGQLDSVSEPVDGLEGALTWRPSGNLIACIRRSDEKIEVVFFERNGLRHGKFDLRFDREELRALGTSPTLKWNSDSNILAVSYSNKVQLWTMSNYQYYLKQELVIREPAAQTVLCTWHPEQPLALIVSSPSALQMVDLLYTTASGPVAPPNDYGVIVSIDGLFLKLTPLRIANVPPPMSLQTLLLERVPVDIAISSSGIRLAVLSETDVSIYSLDITKRPVPTPCVLWRSERMDKYCLRQIAFMGDEQLLILADSWDEGESCLWTIPGPNKLLRRGPVVDAEANSSIVSTVDTQKLYFQFHNGHVHEVKMIESSAGLSPPTLPAHRFPSFAPEAKVAVVGHQSIAFGLTKNGFLYADERVLVRNCTSFVVTPAHLVFTTSQHLLKFVHLTSVEELEVAADEPQKDERCRIIERGAKLVTVMPTTYSVVLQMPRGNLETIYPRALVLAAIRRFIEAESYGDAFLVCRNQRVDMNIIFDYDPDRFMLNIEKIILQLKEVGHIDLLLSQLRNEDVSDTMYRETLKPKNWNTKTKLSQEQIESKVNRVCDAFLAILQRPQHRDAHLQNIVTSHVCKIPPDLEAGLRLVSKLQSNQDALVEKAAEHICFLTDVNQLYDTALGIYDLELSLLIAQQSQRDPREYLPHLQSLHDLTPLRRKFRIDDELGRRSKALFHLRELEAHEEIQEYVRNHALYREALSLYEYDVSHFRQIMRLYADYLSRINSYKDAALAFEYLDDHVSAWPCYRSANLWREALSSATLAGESSQVVESLASSLAEGLSELKDYYAASRILLDYLNDVSAAAKLLCKGCHFAEAIRLVTFRQQPELVEAVVDPGLVERSADMTEFLAEMKSQLAAQVPRLLELRTKKADDPMAFYDGNNLDESASGNIPDNISLAPTDTTSGGTFMTRYTNRTNLTGTINTATTRKTSKNKRREERKRARGKKGTVYEEEYLTNSIERLVERINSMQEEIQRLVEGLMRRGMRERAKAVCESHKEVVKRCGEAVRETYTPAVSAEGIQQSHNVGIGKDEILIPRGGDATLWDSVQEVGKSRTAPIIRSVQQLTLLS